MLFPGVMAPEQPNQLVPEQRRNRTLPLVVAFFCMAALTVGMWVKDREQTQVFEAERVQSQTALNQALAQSKGQIQDLTQRLDAMTAAQTRALEQSQEQQQAQQAKAAPAAAAAVARVRRKPAQPVAANDPRVDSLQGQLADTQQQLARTRDELSGRIDSTRDELSGSLASTRDELSKTRDALSGQISSTRDDLNGSIARNHEEIVALRKRGEQSVYEFRLDKSKQFQRVGPVSVALRSTNTKHKTYDVAMMVDDNQLDKKHVNLYEPIWISLSDRPQPVELVVNRVDKDRISGYIAEPKYKRSELGDAAAKPADKSQQLATR